MRDALDYIEGLERLVDDMYDQFKAEIRDVGDRIDKLDTNTFKELIAEIEEMLPLY
jgi:hypothetical protein